jgi:hypothetical protein
LCRRRLQRTEEGRIGEWEEEQNQRKEKEDKEDKKVVQQQNCFKSYSLA